MPTDIPRPPILAILVLSLITGIVTGYQATQVLLDLAPRWDLLKNFPEGAVHTAMTTTGCILGIIAGLVVATIAACTSIILTYWIRHRRTRQRSTTAN